MTRKKTIRCYGANTRTVRSLRTERIRQFTTPYSVQGTFELGGDGIFTCHLSPQDRAGLLHTEYRFQPPLLRLYALPIYLQQPARSEADLEGLMSLI